MIVLKEAYYRPKFDGRFFFPSYDINAWTNFWKTLFRLKNIPPSAGLRIFHSGMEDSSGKNPFGDDSDDERNPFNDGESTNPFDDSETNNPFAEDNGAKAAAFSTPSASKVSTFLRYNGG